MLKGGSINDHTDSNQHHEKDPDYLPKLKRVIPLGLQHVLAMFVGNITVPIIIGGTIGVTPTEKIFLIQVAIFVAGVATLIQTIGLGPIGARLPIVQGTSFGFLPVSIPIAKTYGLGVLFEDIGNFESTQLLLIFS